MDKDISYGNDYKFIPATSIGSGRGLEVLPDLYSHTIQIVNICLVGIPNTKDFVLVDAEMPDSADKIISVIEERFGANSRPKAIILTHGHFDHVGAIVELVKKWAVPIFAHELELPFLTGKMSYPKPDASVEGGLIAKMSPMFPNEPINLGENVQGLPADGSVPYMPGFRWIHTPGHSPGHISLFRDEDGTLIAGDAFVTVKQDSLYKVLTQELEVNGLPRYFTTVWNAARKSVEKLQSLKPRIAITGHGKPISGATLSNGLKKLVDEFDKIAIPDYGKFVDNS
ncbi:MBL fold metallo-hydrolase [Oceanobacillus chungangensis]|uniref:MBL fold metallo-hydrolase n=1 Tax=Oceanobacillus chungangensis TaxID=1229152 RepID=A0A3D8PL33_9BACI|nr:MBL fold metallo-hydrolase [Oceanobacillus chungangensis]RDW15938.1 MBL fold metallo-hydrolase [Oceanobacillus chungangensis]